VVTINGGSNPGVFTAEGAVTGTFDSSSSLGNLNSQVASQFQRFPVGSTVAAFTFQFDPELNVFRRSTEGLGPLLSERAPTTGKGKFNVSFAYSRVEFDIFEGDDLDHLNLGFTGALHGNTGFRFNNDSSGMNFLVDIPLGPGQQITFIDAGGGAISGSGVAGSHDAAFVNGSVSVPGVRPVLDAELDVDVFAFFLNYGVTDWLDVGAVVPLMNVEGSGQVTTFGITGAPNGVLSTFRKHDSSFGFGDLILRAKARVLTTPFVDAAVRGDVTLPTGDEDEFRGYGNPAFGPTIILSKTFGIVSPHANVGLNFRTDDPDQHSFRWATGLDVQPFEVFTLTADVIGEHLLDRHVNVGEDIYAFSGGVKGQSVGPARPVWQRAGAAEQRWSARRRDPGRSDRIHVLNQRSSSTPPGRTRPDRPPISSCCIARSRSGSSVVAQVRRPSPIRHAASR